MRLALVFAALWLAALPAQAQQVNVFAAASLKNALDEVAADFTARTGTPVVVSYAGSNTLARQIIEGAPADIFISANREWADEVEKAGLVQDRRDLLGNTLVLVAHGSGAASVTIGPDLDLRGMLNGGKLAMALIDSVPAGQYGKAALEHLGIWDGISTEVAQSDNVRAALALVATGEAPLGIVYATDATAQPDVSVVGRFPADSHPPITYPAVLLKDAADDGDRAFFQALSDPAADAVFAQYGFRVID